MTTKPKRPAAQSTTPALEAHASEAASFLKSLANPHRLMILCSLAEGPLAVSALNEHVDLSQSALSQHLAKLKKDQLVDVKARGQQRLYYLKPGPTLDIVSLLQHYFCAERATNKRKNR